MKRNFVKSIATVGVIGICLAVILAAYLSVGNYFHALDTNACISIGSTGVAQGWSLPELDKRFAESGYLRVKASASPEIESVSFWKRTPRGLDLYPNGIGCDIEMKGGKATSYSMYTR